VVSFIAIDEHLITISVLSPWFADIENYLVSTQFPSHLSPKEKRKIVRKSSLSLGLGEISSNVA